MILILSSVTDFSTEDVIDWIDTIGYVDYIRLNGESIEDQPLKWMIGVDSERNDFVSSIDGSCEHDNFTVWYRRWNQHHGRRGSQDASLLELQYFIKREARPINKIILNFIKSPKVFKLGNPNSSSPNKLSVLQAAVDAGLSIPETLVTNRRLDLASFLEKYGSVITKCISDVFFINIRDHFYVPYTVELTSDSIDQYPETFFPSLFQQNIPKDFELRIFYLDGMFYSAAIHSQNNTKTSQDFRQYDFANFNRFSPFKLPLTLQENLIILMKSLNLNSGSIDMIRDDQGRYIFLEINPVGQFGMLSQLCNFPIELEIAKYLISKDESSE